MKKLSWLLACGLAVMVVMTGCGGKKKADYADGTYTGQSENYVNEDEESEEGNGYGVVELTIKDNTITDCTYKTYQLDGTLKEKDIYGRGTTGEIENKDYYRKAQKAVDAVDKYAAQLVETNDIDKVEAISGATVNYDEFVDAVGKCLAQAEVTE